jgi:ariadne-1
MEENDIGFETQDKDIKTPKHAYEVDFTVFDPEQIQAHQDKQIEEVGAILDQPPEAAAILLRHARWNKERLIESYMDNTYKVLESAGLGETASQPPKFEVVKGFCCDICCEDGKGLETFAMRCGHRFCVDCYKHYLQTKIKDEGEAARIRCPGDGCNRIVDSKSLDFLVTSEKLRDRWVSSL